MVLNIAHRGGSKIAPENTIAAMKKSFDFQVDMIEFDIRITKDNRLVVMHDPTVNRTTTGTGVVRDLTLAQLRKLDAGLHFDLHYQGETIPQPHEIFDILPDLMRVNVHLKDYLKHDASQEVAVVKLIQQYKLTERTQIASKYPEVINRIHEIDPLIQTVFLSRDLKEEDYICQSIELKCETVQPTIWWMSPQFVQKAKKYGLKVNVFWADHPHSMRALIEKGVDGILTNRPDILNRIRKET